MKRTRQSQGPIAPGEMGDAEPCEHCFVPRGEHESVADHDFEGIFVYTCRGCPPDIAWTADNMSEHPSYDHDFDWIPLLMDDRERQYAAAANPGETSA